MRYGNKLKLSQDGLFLSGALAPILTSSNLSTNSFLFEIYWWMHIGTRAWILELPAVFKACTHTDVCAKCFSLILEAKWCLKSC